MSSSRTAGQIDLEDLFNWLEQQPELEDIRSKAASTLCEYRPGEATPADRIQCNPDTELNQDTGPLKKLFEIVWVPGRSMRGKAFSTPELDQSLNSVAKLMCISTIWDFVCTIPLFNFSLGVLGVAALPAATALSFILLWASNVAGENSTDRRPKHSAKAMWSLTAFVLLCTAKTVVSGVGIDLMIGSKAVASTYAKKLSQEALAKDISELQRLEKGDKKSQDIYADCNNLKTRMQSLEANREANNTQYVSLFVQAYGANAVTKADRGLTSQQLVDRYGSASNIPGICRQSKAIQDLNSIKAIPLSTSIDQKKQAIVKLPALAYLQKQEPDVFNEHFRLKGDQLEWVNGTEAVAQATDQFYRNLFSGQFGLLGFSLFTLAISIILTGAASIMLYLTGGNPQVHASYTGELNQFRDRRLSEYASLINKQN